MRLLAISLSSGETPESMGEVVSFIISLASSVVFKIAVASSSIGIVATRAPHVRSPIMKDEIFILRDLYVCTDNIRDGFVGVSVICLKRNEIVLD